MGFLRWLGGIVVFFWLIGIIFRIGGELIHFLLIVAAVVFLFDFITGTRKAKNKK
ncbi:MAG: lmo0937 family membrane protein [Eubacteriaceae bacterium]